MPDAGAGPPALHRPALQPGGDVADDRSSLADLGVASERLGYDVFWLTEHHFQHEGYEVVPNGILFGATLAARTPASASARCSTSCPSGTRSGWPRTSPTCTTSPAGGRSSGWAGARCPARRRRSARRIGSFDNPDQADADPLNREQFDEAIEVIRTAFDNERFKFAGRHYTFPPPGIPDRGGLRRAPHPRPPAPPPRRVVAGGHLAPHARGRAPQGLRRGVLAEAPRLRPQLVGALRGAATPPTRAASWPRREADAGADLPDRGHPRAGRGVGPRRPRRVLEVPRPLRLVAGLHGRPTASRRRPA